MASTIELKGYGSTVTVLSGASELNSLANGNLGAVSGTGSGVVLDNTSALYLYADFEFISGTLGGNGTTGNSVDLYWNTSLDGSTYDTFPAAAGSVAPPSYQKVGSFYLPSATTVYKLHIMRVPLMPGKIKFAVFNNTGQALPASGASVVAYPYNMQSV
jgi:hypothetical protein